MGEAAGREEKGSFSPSALSLFRFHLSLFSQKRLIVRLVQSKPFNTDTEGNEVFVLSGLCY